MLRKKYADVPKPDTVQTIVPDLQKFIEPIYGKYNQELQTALDALPEEDRTHAKQALLVLKTSAEAEFLPNGNALDEGRLLMVKDIYSVLTENKLSPIPKAA